VVDVVNAEIRQLLDELGAYLGDKKKKNSILKLPTKE
jgi:hypothetical protein